MSYKFKETESYYDTSTLTISDNKMSISKGKPIIGWYCLGRASKNWTTAFATYYKPNFIKRFFMRILLDFYWIPEE